MKRMLQLDAVLKGMAVAIVISLPVAIVANVVQDDDADSVWLTPLFFTVLVAFVLAGFVAGRGATKYPYTNGAIAALAGFVVMAVISIAVQIADGESIGVGRIVGTGLLSYGCGLTGGVAGARRNTA
jgi:putative membrane protein (TIGR04086 family)